MPGTSPEAASKGAPPHRVYEVLLHHYLPSFTGKSAISTPVSTTSLPSEVALRARFKIRHNQLCLVLTYDPNLQAPARTPTMKRQPSSFKEGMAKRVKSKPQSPAGRKATTPTTPVSHADLHKHPKQYYVVALKDISPLAAQLPLSAELRSHLHLNLVDVEAVTYSSHSTPRTTGLSLNSGCSPSNFASNFYFPPSRGQPVLSQRTRRDSPSPGFAAMTATPTYGQYLSAAEPYKVHTRSLHTPRGPFSAGSSSYNSNHRSQEHRRNPRSASLGEGDFTTIHVSQPASHASSKSCSPLLTPQKEMSFGAHMPLSERNSGLDGGGAVSPRAVRSPTQRADTLTDFGELLLVAFFGVTTAAGVPNLSFTTDSQGEVMVEKKAKKLGKRTWHKSLFRWFVPSKESETVPRRSVSLLSTISAAISSSTGSPQVSPAQPHAPAPLPHTNTARVGKSTPSKSSPATTTTAPVPVAAAHIDVSKVLELPFTLNQHETFHLRFRCEADLREFLTHYVDLQTRLKEAARKKERKTSSGDVSSPLWHPHVHRNRFGEEVEEGEGSGENFEPSQDSEDDFDGDGTASTASYTDFPRNAEALGGTEGNDPLSSDGAPQLHSPKRKKSAFGASPSTPAGAAAENKLVMPPTAFFRSRGWEDYLRYHLDPRFGLPFASVPLYLWHAFMPLAKVVLYTCYRGFLIVERVPAETTHSDEEAGGIGGGSAVSGSGVGGDAERTVEEGRQRLNALVNRLLTPIRTAQNPPRHPPSSSRLSRHGLVEVLPVAPLPMAEKKDTTKDPYNSCDASSWDAVKLVLPSADEATEQHNNDHFTTVKDVFLCLSESHLLFLNSFGHLRFQCSLDEIALITHSAATAAFPTYPFFRFRLKGSDYFGAPTFVLTFTLLPEVPHEVRAASPAAAAAPAPAAAAPTFSPRQQQKRSSDGMRGRTRSLSTASSRSTSASSASPATAADASASAIHLRRSSGVCMLGDDEKERLLHRHEEFLRIFATVCPRPLEYRTFAEMIAGEMGRGHRIRVSHLLSVPQKKVSGSPLQCHVPLQRGTSWMAQNYNAHPILCVKVEADDIELYDTEVAAEAARRPSTVTSTLTASNATSARQRDTSTRRRSKTSTSPEIPIRHPSRAVTPRWGLEDPGIVLQDGGRDMDFSLEVATRTMPLLANKEEVHAGYGSSVASTQPSFHPDLDAHLVEDSNGGTCGAADDFVPMAPKKKRSIILHRTAL